MSANSDDDRASQILDRLDDLGFGDGLVEDDVSGTGTREPFRSCCLSLSKAIWALNSDRQDARIASLRSAVLAVQHAVSTEQTAKTGRLDETLSQLITALQATPPHSPRTRLDMLELLISALQSSAMIKQQEQSTTEPGLDSQNTHQKSLEENQDRNYHNGHTPNEKKAFELSSTLRSIAEICGIEPTHSTAEAIAEDINNSIDLYTQKLPSHFFDSILHIEMLTPDQYSHLEDIDATFKKEYTLRRRMLIERIKATLLSFSWSTRLSAAGEEEAACRAQEERENALKNMHIEPGVALDDVFRCTLGQILSITERATSAGGSRSEGGMSTRIKEVLMGSVPDRGGRTEGRSRTADMPAWSARKAGGGRGSSGGGRGKGRKVGKK